MLAQQLHLFDPARPLLLRFGADFFKAVPPAPGVYIMGGEADRVLYIGQSGNLRKRLHTYKNARLDRAPRKVVRLVHCVRSLVWEECETAEAARVREVELLQIHRPKFNVMDTYPAARRCIGLAIHDGRLELSLLRAPAAGRKMFGPFKAGTTGAFGALLRLLWAALHQPASPHDFPARLLQPRPPAEFVVRPSSQNASPMPDALAASLQQFLGGQSGDLIQLLTAALPTGPDISNFQRNLLAEDLATLQNFFEHIPRHQRLGVVGRQQKQILIGRDC